MKKKVLLTISIILVIIVITVSIIVTKDLLNDGYAYYGDVWQDTPEKALIKSADMSSETMQTLTPELVLETRIVDDIVLMTFLSKSDTLVTASFVTNKNGQYCVEGWTEEIDLDNPTEFLMTGAPNQLILFPYYIHNTSIYGWCYSSAQFTINNVSPSRKSFTFEAQEKKRTIDFWIISDCSTIENVSINYTQS